MDTRPNELVNVGIVCRACEGWKRKRDYRKTGKVGHFSLVVAQNVEEDRWVLVGGQRKGWWSVLVMKEKNKAVIAHLAIRVLLLFIYLFCFRALTFRYCFAENRVGPHQKKIEKENRRFPVKTNMFQVFVLIGGSTVQPWIKNKVD